MIASDEIRIDLPEGIHTKDNRLHCITLNQACLFMIFIYIQNAEVKAMAKKA